MKCPVCNNDTFDDNDYEYEICKECFWEYDVFQLENPDERTGANNHSLNEFKKKYNKLKQENPNFSCKNPKDKELMLKFELGK